MADIALALLVFFVLLIVPKEESGILMRMRHWSEEPPPSVEVQKRNVLHIAISYSGDFMLEGEISSIDTLKNKIIEFIINPTRSPELAESPKHAKVLFHYGMETHYDNFIKILVIVKSAYKELWDKKALEIFKRNYSQLTTSERQFIRSLIPFSFEEVPHIPCF